MSKMKLTHGNSKLGKDTVIINITSATDCPSRALGLCPVTNKGMRCYALKAETSYARHVALPHRREQEKLWDRYTADEIAEDIMLQIARKRTEITNLRYSEAGDFRSQDDVDKMSRIAERLSEIDVVVYGYTARSDLDFSRVHGNMVVNGSWFMVHNEFRCVPEPTGDHVVCSGDCATCPFGRARNGEIIEVRCH